ncbi:MAG: zinc-dependent alcohol dehydrogenase family protein [Hyphomicrobiaceae bacterium]|nr:zinc-dependent alcohol dehydrogenase family protein [Hyphomicrobiaceae bacterium]MCC0007859.1 zinc-dependent alcohol dehydrogenase family protein [Hyphomicrobiaceae bacterium]
MKAMILEHVGKPLVLVEREPPQPGPGQVLVEIAACAVCRTDLHVVDGDLPAPKPRVIPGHEIVGRVVALGRDVDQFRLGDRVGIPWLGTTCGTCGYCRSGRENLCDRPGFTGYQIDGGFATHTLADARYCFAIPETYDDVHAAPLLCAGLIGHRALKAAGEAQRLGIYGFGAAAHIVAQVARHQGRRVFAFTRPGDTAAQTFARTLGCEWAGSSAEASPEPLDAVIIFAPVGPLVPLALKALAKGGTLVLGGIHMSDIPSMPYALLWGERVVRSVANLTRQDGVEFMLLAGEVPLDISVETFPLDEANEALQRLRDGRLSGAAVLIP